jgi:DNA-binding CsgD family transcriptional regulator
LRLLAAGLVNAEIAERLSLSPRTVNAHLTTIYGKLGVATRGAAIRFALKRPWLKSTDILGSSTY